jgi:hypothetical protein
MASTGCNRDSFTSDLQELCKMTHTANMKVSTSSRISSSVNLVPPSETSSSMSRKANRFFLPGTERQTWFGREISGTPRSLSAVTYSPTSSSSCRPQDVLAEFNLLVFRSWITWKWKNIIRPMFYLKHPSPHITFCDYPAVTRFCFQYQMGATIALPQISLNTQGLSFRKVGYSRYDVP